MAIKKMRISSARKNEAQKEANVSSPESMSFPRREEDDEGPDVKSFPATVLKDVTHTVRTSANTLPSPTIATR